MFGQTSDDPLSYTLTFYYDNLRSSRTGKTIGIPSSAYTPDWLDYIYTRKVVFDPSFANARPTSTYRWFYKFYYLETITGIEYLNTSAVTNMREMFSLCYRLTSLNLSSFNTAKVTDMREMFYACFGLTSLNLNGFNTAKVTNMNDMFCSCQSLTSLDLSSFNTSNVTNMETMFGGCEALTSLNLSSFNTANVLHMSYMFMDCSNLKTIYVDDEWSTAGICDGIDVFTNCTSLVGEKGTTYNANRTNYTYARIDGGYYSPGYFTAFTHPEAYACYTPSNTTLTFYYDKKRSSRSGTTYNMNTGTNTPGWFNDGSYSQVTKVVFDPLFTDARPTTTYSWFDSMTKLQTITGIEYLNTSEVTNMSNMFYGCEALTSLDLSSFNTAKVTDMSGMFINCEALPSLNLSSFNTAKVTTMYRMFRGCEALTSLDLSSFNTVKVTDMKMMFYYCTHLKTISVSEYWNTTAVKTSNDMFAYCTRLVGGAGTTFDANHVDVSYAHIDGGTSNPGYLTAMIEPKAYVCYSSSNTTLTFYYDNQFINRPGNVYDLKTGINLPGWAADYTNAKVTRVVFDSSFAKTSRSSTYLWFYGMEKLQSITGIEYLNTNKVSNMYGMFFNCKALTSLDLSNFNTAKVTDMSYMFQGCTSLTTIYAGDDWSTDKVTSSDNMFKDCTKLVGSKGTTYDENHVDASYAHIDGGTSNPGYLSASIRGDVNLDGTVDIADAVSVLNAMAGQTVAGDANVNGDFDDKGNPVIDIVDLVTVLNIMAGQ